MNFEPNEGCMKSEVVQPSLFLIFSASGNSFFKLNLVYREEQNFKNIFTFFKKNVLSLMEKAV